MCALVVRCVDIILSNGVVVGKALRCKRYHCYDYYVYKVLLFLIYDIPEPAQCLYYAMRAWMLGIPAELLLGLGRLLGVSNAMVLVICLC